MDTLIILLLFQFAGTALCTIFSCLRNLQESKTIYISNKVAPPAGTRVQAWPWIEEYFQSNPGSTLKKMFPDSYKIAIATKSYKELIGLRQSCRLSKRRYERRLRRILKLIDIKLEVGETGMRIT